MTATHSALLMTMSDVAALAQVKRPVVSMWRSRAAHSSHPFPAPLSRDAGRDLFDSIQVGKWLAETGRGNNPDAAADAAAHAAPFSNSGVGEYFDEITALLALRALVGMPLAPLGVDGILDSADEADPDDALLFRELELTTAPLLRLALFVDDAFEAGYGAAAAFERLVNERNARVSADIANTTLSATAVDLLAQTVSALASTRSEDPAIVDVLGTSTDLLVALAGVDAFNGELTVTTASGDDEEARLERRRLAVQGIANRTLDVHDDGSFEVKGSAVHLVQLPVKDERSDEMLSTLERIILNMDDAHLAVIVGPSEVLSDSGLERDAEQIRSDLLRSGRVRAIVRLPAGLRRRKPQQAQTLWIVGDTSAPVDIADRWTMVADLSAVRLDSTTINDLVSDLAASLGNLATIRAHAFRFTRLVLTRTLLAGKQSLVSAATQPANTTTRPAESTAARVDALVVKLAAGFSVEATQKSGSRSTMNVGQLVTGAHLRYIPGNRLAIADGEDATDGFRIIGPSEVTGELPLGERRIDRLEFAANYPAGRVTEPGDIIFCTTPRIAAIVDVEGTSVVAYPARILRIDRRDPNGLLSEVVAEDIRSQQSGNKRWRRWQLRQVDQLQRAALTDALTSLRLQQQQARARLENLDELATLLMSGITSGSLALTHTSQLPALSEGTI